MRSTELTVKQISHCSSLLLTVRTATLQKKLLAINPLAFFYPWAVISITKHLLCVELSVRKASKVFREKIGLSLYSRIMNLTLIRLICCCSY